MNPLSFLPITMSRPIYLSIQADSNQSLKAKSKRSGSCSSFLGGVEGSIRAFLHRTWFAQEKLRLHISHGRGASSCSAISQRRLASPPVILFPSTLQLYASEVNFDQRLWVLFSTIRKLRTFSPGNRTVFILAVMALSRGSVFVIDPPLKSWTNPTRR